ncbi:hypothetical protein CKM354_000184600 [Cercospora kikuchii]|uniref:Uncharacterized protein n=1 Tax=Cercospora kikuchii TaxID=84275 RepID=A0A9P3FD38_9PEZI|nr:uncharacterized protein CKM354_000184600 [Cercospora kikuchii]GIZ38429.1 hypothetical protein CKM354_000184600 [Cercospora kikuchii]
MYLNANIALLIAGAPLGFGLPLLGGVLGTVSSLTGTHIAGSAVPVGSTSSGLTKAATTTATTTATKTTTGGSNAAGALGPVLGLADPVLAPVAGAGGTVSGLLASVPALIEAKCDTKYQKCTVSVSGQIENMLTDGGNFTGKATISAWMKDGRGYGSADLAGAAPLPFQIECNPATNVCLGTLAGNVTQVFSNGKQIALWGWATPSGSCKNGTCVGSLTACGDPGYKAKRGDLC